MIDKLINKPVLVETIPPALEDEATVEKPDQIIVAEDKEKEDFKVVVNEEIKKYDQLLEYIEPLLPPVPVDEEEFGVAEITPTVLREALHSADPAYPNLAATWTEYHYKTTGTLGSIVYSSLQQLKQELEYSLDLMTFPDLPKEVLEIEKESTSKKSEYRKRLEAEWGREKENLEECFVSKLGDLIISGKVGSFSQDDGLQKVVSMLKTLRAALRLYIVTRTTKVKVLQQKLATRLSDIITAKLSAQLLGELGRLEQQLVFPLSSALLNFSKLNTEYFCGAFDDFISRVTDEMALVRSRYLHTLYDYTQLRTEKILDYEHLLDFGVERSKVAKELVLLDKLLAAAEYALSSGYLTKQAIDQLINEVKNAGKKNTPKTGTEKGGNP